MKITPEHITELQPNQVFVFGSNLSGIHGKGAAAYAQKHFGAKRGVGIGMTGQCYAIPTRGVWNQRERKFDPMPIDQIGERVFDFIEFARTWGHGYEFLVTPIGCGYAGFQPHQIAVLFPSSIPENVALPAAFWEVIRP